MVGVQSPAKLILLLLASLPLAAGCGNKIPGPSLTRTQLLDPETCGGCHPVQYQQWAGSMHAYAANDPVFVAMNQCGQRETGGALGTFCVNCHAPMAVRDGKTTDGLNLATLPTPYQGVTCYFCHTVTAVNGTHNNPLELNDANTMFGAFSNPVANNAHPSKYSALHDRGQLDSATLCGSCHDIVAPPGAAIERTFTEWQASAFAKPPVGNTCSQCHMNQSETLEPIAQAPGAGPRRAHDHAFPAVDLALDANFAGPSNAAAQRMKVQSALDSALQAALCVSAPVAGQVALRVILDNVAAGHNFPSGSAQDRRTWVEVVASAANQVIYQSGVVQAGDSITVVQNDPDLWLMRDCMFDAQGKPVDMFWQAASYESNTLPGLLTFDQNDTRFYQTHIVQYYPRDPLKRLPGAPDSVSLRVRMQPMGLDVADSLIASGDLDANVRAQIVTFDLGPGLTWTAAAAGTTPAFVEGTVPYFCVSTPNFNLAAQRTPAVNHTACAP